MDEPTLDALVARFEARGRHPEFSGMLREYLDAMHIDDAELVLDLGCGTGVVARVVAHRPAFRGTVVGVDLSPHLIAAARQLAAGEGIAGRVEFRAGDALNLDDGETYDAVVAHTLFSHFDNAPALLDKAARVLRPGGLLAVFDGDYASLTFDYADEARARVYDDALVRALVANPRVMRHMPRLLSAAGLQLVASFSYVLSEIGTGNFWSSAIEAYRRLIPKSGVMAEEEANEWAAGLHRDSESGVFFGSCNYYAFVAQRSV